jgi:G:T-mismatch repair DNA endonuclease (very short patch repair protein)
MSIILKIVRETFYTLYFELPSEVEYVGLTTNLFKMTSPANLISTLAKRGEQLVDLLIGKENFSAHWISAKIVRGEISVKRFASSHEKQEAKLAKKNQQFLDSRMRSCAICGVSCLKGRKSRGCCSDECKKKRNEEIGKSIAQNHWTRSDNASDVLNRRLVTRKSNDVTLDRHHEPWNKGKTGVYSAETLEKIRASALRQFHEEKFKKTIPEKKIEEMLKQMNIDYKYSFILCSRQFDFVISSKKIIIEHHGDFWHGNPKFWGPELKELRDHQLMKQVDDIIKKKLAEDNGYKYIYFWEDDVVNRPEEVKERIRELANE